MFFNFSQILNFKEFDIMIFGQILRNQNMNFCLNFTEFQEIGIVDILNFKPRSCDGRPCRWMTCDQEYSRRGRSC